MYKCTKYTILHLIRMNKHSDKYRGHKISRAFILCSKLREGLRIVRAALLANGCFNTCPEWCFSPLWIAERTSFPGLQTHCQMLLML